MRFCAVLFLLVGVATARIWRYVCDDGQKIGSLYFCDGDLDCADGSDERSNKTSCPACESSETMMTCTSSYSNKTCYIERDYVCNKTVDCIGITDLCDIGCPGYYKCQGSNKCVQRTTVCDGTDGNGCGSNEDWKNGVGFQCKRNGLDCVIPQQMLYDNVQDCDSGVDICYLTNLTKPLGSDIRNYPGARFDPSKCFVCLDGTMVIPRQKVCDGVINCDDLSDECLCSSVTAPICNYVRLQTYSGENGNNTCKVGQVQCAGANPSKCLERTQVCNAVADCSNNLDERFQYCKGTLPCHSGRKEEALQQCRCKITQAKTAGYGILCNGKEECPQQGSWVYPPGFPESECEADCPKTANSFNCTKYSIYYSGLGLSFTPCSVWISLNPDIATTKYYANYQACDGRMFCTADGADEADCPSRFKCQAGDLVNIPISKKCDGYQDCDNGEDETVEICGNGRFFCQALDNRKVSIKKEFVCDFYINCDDASDEMNCTDRDGRWYCEDRNPLFVAKSKILNGINDCNDWSDECSEKFKSDANILSSRYDLIANPILRGIVWIMAILALGGNATVIVDEIMKLRGLWDHNSSASVRANHILILNLATADFLMGAYLLMLGIAGAMYSGVFCSYSLQWLGSASCVAMGILVVLSSETSVMMMFLLTTFRIYAVSRPFQAASKPSTSLVIFVVALVWTTSILLSSMPIWSAFQETFVETAFVSNNTFFDKSVVSFDEAKTFVLKMFTFAPELSDANQTIYQMATASNSWNDLESFVENHAQYSAAFLNLTRYYGYYSSSSVCIPKFFVTRRDLAWKFSLSISIINFVVFFFVAIAYGVILSKAQKSAVKTSSSKGKPNENSKIGDMQRKVFRLIATDFCCWVPLSIMVFINFSGIQIDSISYAVSAIILLPINSALNPILYSPLFDNLLTKCQKERKRRASRSTSSSGLTGSTKV